MRVWHNSLSVCLFLHLVGHLPSSCPGPCPAGARGQVALPALPLHTCSGAGSQTTPGIWAARVAPGSRLLSGGSTGPASCLGGPRSHSAPWLPHLCKGLPWTWQAGGASYFRGGVKGCWLRAFLLRRKADGPSLGVGGTVPLAGIPKAAPVWRREDQVSARLGQGLPGHCIF